MAESKRYDRVKEITDQLEQGIQDLFESDRYKTWLTTMSRFHDYSLNNTLLIAFQKPDATLVAGYTTWKNQFGRQVQKGQKAIRILAPTPYKQKIEREKLDPITHLPMKDKDGKPVKETQEVLRPAFKVVSVFDVSQTEGREMPTLGVDELSGEVRDFDIFFEALKRVCPVPIELTEIEGGAKGYFHLQENRIAIQKDMSQLQTVKTAVHEIVHQKLHSLKPDGEEKEERKLTRNAKEVEAESVAFTVCQRFGLDTSDYSFAYIAGWSHGKETPELKASLKTIRQASAEMIDAIEEQMQILHKERNAEKEQNEVKNNPSREGLEDTAQKLAAELDSFAYEFDPYGYGDEVEDRAVAVDDLKNQLLAGDSHVQGMKDYLREVAEEGGEYAGQAGVLLAEINEFELTSQNMEVEQTLQNLAADAQITFYVAECMEFPNLGELHENLTLQEAFAIYDRIPAERMNGIKGIGFELKDGSIYDGQFPLMEAGRLATDAIDLVEHYRESPLVQQAVSDCRDLLEQREQNTVLDASDGVRTPASKRQARKSVLADLHEKKSRVNGVKAPSEQGRTRRKEMEQA